MPKCPKYSDRVNFFFVINGMEVPMKRNLSIIEKFKAKVSESTKANRTLLQALSLAATTERDWNKSTLPEAKSYDVRELRAIFLRFFFYADKVLSDTSLDCLHQMERLLALLNSTVGIVNALLQGLDNTWLLKYGSISAECLEYQSPLEFLELLPIAGKILGKSFKGTVEKLTKLSVTLRTIHDFKEKRSLTESIPQF